MLNLFIYWKSFKNLLWELDLKECESLLLMTLQLMTLWRKTLLLTTLQLMTLWLTTLILMFYVYDFIAYNFMGYDYQYQLITLHLTLQMAGGVKFLPWSIFGTILWSNWPKKMTFPKFLWQYLPYSFGGPKWHKKGFYSIFVVSSKKVDTGISIQIQDCACVYM